MRACDRCHQKTEADRYSVEVVEVSTEGRTTNLLPGHCPRTPDLCKHCLHVLLNAIAVALGPPDREETT